MTAIWLVVRVPVLSEQITVVQPSVSTDGKLHARGALGLQSSVQGSPLGCEAVYAAAVGER